MSFEYVIHIDDKYVETCFTNDLTTDLVISYLTKVWANNPEIKGFSELLDMRQIHKIDMDTGDLAEIVDLGRALDDETQESNIALLVDDAHDTFKISLYQTLQNLYPAQNKQVELFTDKNSAREWLIDN